MLGSGYSAATISNVTDVTIKNIEGWQQRPLQKRYSILYLNGTYIKLRRDDVAGKVVYIVIGMTEEGYREILGFYMGGQENALSWREILRDLYDRGTEEILLGVFDGLPGLEASMKEMYPKADVQRCVVHKIRNAFNLSSSTLLTVSELTETFYIFSTAFFSFLEKLKAFLHYY